MRALLLALAAAGLSLVWPGRAVAQAPAGRPPLVFFDLETTGLDTQADEILQIGALKVDPQTGRQLGRMSLKVKPTRAVPAEVAALNHYTAAGWKKATPLGDALRRFTRFAEGGQLAGHNVGGYDIPMLFSSYQRAGQRPPHLGDFHPVDTASLARVFMDAGQLPDARLRTLADRFGVANPRAHDALADIRTTEKVYFKMSRLLVQGLDRGPRPPRPATAGRPPGSRLTRAGH